MPRLFLALVLAASTALAACTGIRVLPAPEAPGAALPRIAGMPDGDVVRFWGDREDLRGQLASAREEIAARIREEGKAPNHGRLDILALSGGGPDGAYGAGLIDGWSDREGTGYGVERPEFGLVTGVSVGALIAPFAFLGPAYDDALEHFFTTTTTSQLIAITPFSAIFGYSLGLTDVQPLQHQLAEIITPAFVAEIAKEHRKGRRLWIGTTWLDAERPVIWDIGAIAVANYPRKAELIRRILLASAAIPGVFPPVEIEVEIGGKRYAEMHVDGSVTQQFFVFPRGILHDDLIDRNLENLKPGTIYLVRNSTIEPDYDPVAPSLLAITQRALFTLTNEIAIGDVTTIAPQAEAEGWRLVISAVPSGVRIPSTDFFDPVYMSTLFGIGYERALEGDAWTVLNESGGLAPAVLADAE